MREQPEHLSKSHYPTLRDSGDMEAMSTNRCMADFDMKILQQKKHEAEVKRSGTFSVTDHLTRGPYVCKLLRAETRLSAALLCEFTRY